MEQVARWPWNAWPDESGLGGRMAWNPHSDLALLAFDQGCSEVEWARRVFADFTRPNTLHIAFGSTTRHDPFIRASFYRNLLPYPCLGVPDTAHFLDLDVLLRAILLIRPGECPWDVETLTGGAAGLYLRIPRHPATQSALIWPGIPGPSGHLFHGHPAGQSERSDAGVALLVRVGWRRQFLRPFAH